MLKKLHLLVVCLLIFSQFLAYRQAQARPLFNAYDLIDAINALRAANGLSPYNVNSILMSIAQGHSNYQASIGEVTHTGPGGSRPRDRAAAAGYGGGGTFFISENIAGGTNLSAAEAVSMWQGDDLHLGTLLGPNYRDVGAGVAVSGDFVYFTLDVAWVAGGASNPPAATLQGTPGSILPATAITFVVPVKISTPSANGVITHTVQYGQTLYGIADAYKVTLAQIKTLNKLTGDTIYEGDKLIIQTGYTPTPSNQPTATQPTLTPTLRPTRTPRPPTGTPAPTQDITATPTPLPAASAMQISGVGGDPLLLSVVIVAALGFVMMVVGSLLKSKKPKTGM